MSAPAVLLTGVGKRYDIVACFARLTKTVVADPAPLAPAQYAAHVRASVPLIEDGGYVAALEELCERHGVGRYDDERQLRTVAVQHCHPIEQLSLERRRLAGSGARARPQGDDELPELWSVLQPTGLRRRERLLDPLHHWALRAELQPVRHRAGFIPRTRRTAGAATHPGGAADRSARGGRCRHDCHDATGAEGVRALGGG